MIEKIAYNVPQDLFGLIRCTRTYTPYKVSQNGCCEKIEFVPTIIIRWDTATTAYIVQRTYSRPRDKQDKQDKQDLLMLSGMVRGKRNGVACPSRERMKLLPLLGRGPSYMLRKGMIELYINH